MNLIKYARSKISPNLCYVTERGERNTKDGNGKGEVQGKNGFFPYTLSFGGLPLPPHTRLAGKA